MNICAPDKVNSPYTIVKTCYDLPTLKRMATYLNKEKGCNINLNSNKNKLWEEIKKALKDKCDNKDERCFAENTMNKNLISEFFRPKKPDGDFTWLSNFDIEEIMKQYERKHKDFKFFGALPSDFQKIRTQLNGQLIENLIKEGKIKYGIVFNTDPSTKSGQHWVSFFMEIKPREKKGTVEYFDSLGDKPIPSVKDYMRKLCLYCDYKHNYNIEQKINNKVFQKKYDGDCGVFAINFIISRLNGKSFEKIIKGKINELEFNKCRNFYFSQ